MKRWHRSLMLGAVAAGFSIPALLAIPAQAGVTIDVALTKTHQGDFTVGQTGVFTFTISNAGASSTSTDVLKVTDDLPAGLTYVSDTGTASGYPCTHTGQHVECTGQPTPIAAGGSVSFTVTVAVDATAVPSVVNTAVVSDEFGADPNQANNTATDTVTVNPAATTTTTTTTTATTTTTTTAPQATAGEALPRTGFPTAAAVLAALGAMTVGLVALRLRRLLPDSH